MATGDADTLFLDTKVLVYGNVASVPLQVVFFPITQAPLYHRLAERVFNLLAGRTPGRDSSLDGWENC
jgi:hypothetical protein